MVLLLGTAAALPGCPPRAAPFASAKAFGRSSVPFTLPPPPQFSFGCCRAFRSDGVFLVKCQARGKFLSLMPSQLLCLPHGGGGEGRGQL